MGRWNYSNRETVEECRTVDINYLKREGLLECSKEAPLKWINPKGKENSIKIKSFVNGEPFSMVFEYTITYPNGNKEELNYKVPLVKTPCNFGGFRYWFKCGGIVNGVYCGKRVSKLYKPPSEKYFLCRHCYNLTYYLRKKSKDWNYESDRIEKKINKIDRKMKKKGIHSKTYKRLLKKKEFLEADLHGAQILEAERMIARAEKG